MSCLSCSFRTQAMASSGDIHFRCRMCISGHSSRTVSTSSGNTSTSQVPPHFLWRYVPSAGNETVPRIPASSMASFSADSCAGIPGSTIPFGIIQRCRLQEVINKISIVRLPPGLVLFTARYGMTPDCVYHQSSFCVIIFRTDKIFPLTDPALWGVLLCRNTILSYIHFSHVCMVAIFPEDFP